MTEQRHLRTAIAAERQELAELLWELEDHDWNAPSLCEGWRVHEVVAHITMAFRYSTGRFLRELVRAAGRFDRMADRCARRDAARHSPTELTQVLADNTEHPWKPPGSGYEAALSHDVIHGLDITVALGLDRKVPAARLRYVLDGQTERSIRYFGVDLDGVELRADDLDWTYGSGTPLHGAAQDLLLVQCGRLLPAGRLRGEPSPRFERSYAT